MFMMRRLPTALRGLKRTLFLISPPGVAGIKELFFFAMAGSSVQLDLYAYTLLATVGRPVW